MARMIPPFLDPTSKSPGEKDIFRRLAQDQETEGWICLHSLDISDHQSQLAGEADFVILVPDLGVLCLEVKAHRQVYCHNGKWYLGTDGLPKRSPFKQASAAMYSLLGAVKARDARLARTLFWSAVAFPFVPFTQYSPEWHPWQIINQQKYASRQFSQCVTAVLHAAWDFASDKGKAGAFLRPTLEDCSAIAEILRPSFEFFESPKQRLHQQREEIRHYTAEQFSALDAMEANPRVVFEGPAGTGKTLLAIEAARRSAAKRRKVLFLCYNAQIGKWLADQMRELAAHVTCRTLHAHLYSIAGERAGRATEASFWNRKLPEAATDVLLDRLTGEPPDDMWQYDELIVDEAQDILQAPYLDFLNYSLKGGFETGNWLFFGDFDRQAIYGLGHNPVEEFLATRSSGALRYRLRNNCRNTPRIASFIELYANLDPKYARVLREDDGIEPDIFYYTDDAAQRAKLTEILDALRDDGYAGGDVVVLSPKKDVRCAAARIDCPPWRDRLKSIDKASPGHTLYTTVHAFKGMEAAAVIVTDIERLDDEVAVDLFYVGASRAHNRLFILAAASLEGAVERLLLHHLAGRVHDRP